MDIAVLGPVELRDAAGDAVPVAGARLRTLLVLLALQPSRTVPASRLIDGVWGDAPPAAAGNALQGLVSRLRRAGLVIEAAPSGYRLVIEPERVDAHRFEQIARADPDGALGLWRGPLEFPAVARADAVRLEEERLAAQQRRLAARIDRGEDVLPELEALVTAHPLHEPVAALLIRGLLRAGSPGRALAAFERIRADLADSLGADPSPELAALHLQILRGHLHGGPGEGGQSRSEQGKRERGERERGRSGRNESGGNTSGHSQNRHGQSGPGQSRLDQSRQTALARSNIGPSHHAQTPSEQPADPPHPPKSNLPATVSSFVGRENDVRELRKLIQANRLVTMIGPGGSGKTRLSIEAAPRLTDTLRDGVWRVELAPITDPAEVAPAILTALRLRSQVLLARPGRGSGSEQVEPLTRLAEAISGKDLLLILDNCEHLIGTAATVADELLRSAPGLRLLATSREPLGIAGERLFPVEPLALPPADVGAGTAPTFPAMRLLMDRATGFTLDDDTVGPAARIVRALDGMPLAIELAAARLRTLPIAVLADRLADRFRLLTGGSRTALPRHQTLRAVVDWSWDLLTEPERALWRRFAVFAGGADVTAVENVCDADIDLLGALVDKSLLVLAPDGRYRMLETIREYGRERLAEAGEEEKARLALAGYLLDLAGRAEPELRGADQLMWLRRLTDEHDNFHAALRAAIDAGDAAVACAMTARLGWYWWLRGHRVEGASLAGEVIDLGGEPDPADLAVTYCFHALNGLEGASSIEEVKDSFRAAERLSHLSDHPVLRMVRPLAAIYELRSEVHGFELTRPLFDDPDPWIRAAARMITAQLLQNYGHSGELAMTEMQEALDAFRAIGERWGTGFTLSSLGDMAAARGDFAQAVDYQREAIALVREVGIREDLPQLEVKLAHQLWLAGEHAEARRMLKQAKATAEDIGLAEVMASVIYGAATNARLEGSLDEARDLMAQAAESIANSAFGPQFWAISRSTQGLIEAEAGDLAAARAFHTEAIEVAMASNDSPVIAMVLVGVADLALRGGDPAEAARLLGAADAVRGSIDRSVPDVDRIEAAARAALGDAGFSDAYAKGSGVTAASALGASGLKPAA